MLTRKRLRLKNYDYRQANAFFITICCYQRRHLFGRITGEKMHLNAYGQFAHDQWLALADAYPHIALGEFVIMPNHMHGVIYLGEWEYDDSGDDDALDANGDHRNLAYGGNPDGETGGVAAGGGKPLPCEQNADSTVREGRAPSLEAPPSLTDIIGAYKSLTYRDCLILAKQNNERLGKLWHRSFYENIIRTPEAARRIRIYIRNNVRAWARDKFYGRK